MTNAIKFQGISLTWNSNAVGEITDVTHSESVSELDATSADSAFREIMAGLPDPGDVTFSVNLVPGNTAQDALRTDMRAGTARAVAITLTDTGALVFGFSAICTAFSFNGSTNGLMTASVTLRKTTVVTES